MGNRHADHLAGVVALREWRVGPFDPQIDIAADELEGGVAHQHSRQEARLAQDLEPVANAEHEATLRRKGPHRVHDRRAGRDCAATQIVAVGKAARHHREIGTGGNAVSACHTMTGSRPDTRRNVRAMSRSRLMPGKTMTAAFMLFDGLQMRFACASQLPRRLQHLDT